MDGLRARAFTAGRSAVLLGVVALAGGLPVVGDMTLNDADLTTVVQAVAEGTDLEYVICGAPPRQAVLTLVGDDPPSLLGSALTAFGCRWTRLGDLFIADARPTTQSPADVLLEYLEQRSPMGALPHPLPAESLAALHKTLLEFWEERYKRLVPADAAALQFVPFATKDDGELDMRLRRETYVVLVASVVASSQGDGPPSDAWLALERGQGDRVAIVLCWQAGLTEERMALGVVPAAPPPDPPLTPAQTGRMLEQQLLPPALNSAARWGFPGMSAPVTLEFTGTIGGLPAAFAPAGALRVNQAAAGVPLLARLGPRPAWLALTLVSAASGLLWGPLDVAEAYDLGPGPAPEGRVFAALDPAWRLAWYRARTNAPTAPLSVLHAGLGQRARGDLEAGRLAVSGCLSDAAAGPALGALFDVLFRQSRLSGALEIVREGLWDRHGAAGVYVTDGSSLLARMYKSSPSSVVCYLVTKESPPNQGRELGGRARAVWRSDGNPPRRRRAWPGALRDEGSDGRSVPSDPPQRYLGAAPGPPLG